MKKSFHQNLIYVWLTVVSVALAFALQRGSAARPFDQINVHRINIIEPDGKPRVIIANSKLFPGAYMNGKEYRHIGRESGKAPTGGLLFFNDDGDEAGGLIFSSSKVDGQQIAGSFLSLDQYKQNEAMALRYYEDGGGKQVGLYVYEQPDESIVPLLKLSDKAARAETEADRAAVYEEMEELVKGKIRFADRFFAGKKWGDAIVDLSDKKGNVRLRMKVTEAGAASLEFLDEAGKVTKRITP